MSKQAEPSASIFGGTVGLDTGDTMREISGPRLSELEEIKRAVKWVQANGVCVRPLPTGTWGMTIYGADRTAHSYGGETWFLAVQKAMKASGRED